MNRIIISLIALGICVVSIAAQKPQDRSVNEQDMIRLSNSKWDWMSEKNVEKLAELFHDNAQFVHMGGYWGKEAELNNVSSI